MVTGDQYFFAVHFHRSFPFAKQVRSDYHKAEITNVPIPGSHLLRFEDLLGNGVFIEAFASGARKNRSMEARERKYIDYTDRGSIGAGGER